MKKDILILGWLLTFFACDKMSDLHREYIKDGEIFYLTSPDSTVFLADSYSVLLKLWMYNAPNVKTVNIYWENGKDSLIVPVSFHTGKDSVNIKITGLEEKTYTFTVYMADNFGNRSIPVTGSCNVIGNIWLSSLPERTIGHVSNFPSIPVIIYWNEAPGDVIYSEIEYENASGETKTLQVSNNEESTRIPDAKLCMRIKYRSVYQLASGIIAGEMKHYTPVWSKVEIIGDFTGWGFMYPIYPDESNSFVFIWENVLLTQGGFRFGYNGAWDTTIGPNTLRPNIENGPVLHWNYFDPEKTDPIDIQENMWYVPESLAGNYRITLDLNEMRIDFEKL